MDRASVKFIVADVNEALAQVAAKHNLDFNRKNGSFSATAYTGRFEFVDRAMEGSVNAATKEAQSYRLFGHHYDLEKDKLGVLFTFQGSDWVFMGVATQRPKYPIVARNFSTNQMVKMPASRTVVAAINAATAKV